MNNLEILKYQKLSYLLLRVLGSGIFLVAGLNHLVDTAKPAAKLAKAPLGYLVTNLVPAETLILLSGIALLIGGLLLLFGYQTRKAALLLMLVLIPITITVQVGGTETTGPLFKNIAIFGILIFHVINGAMYYSVDQILSKKNQNRILNVYSNVSMAVVLFLIFGMGFFLSSFTYKSSIPKPVEAALEKKINHAVLISQPDHLKAAVNTAQAMRADSKYLVGEFRVMACGKSVEAFKTDIEFLKLIEAGKAAGINFTMCGMSMEKFKRIR